MEKSSIARTAGAVARYGERSLHTAAGRGQNGGQPAGGRSNSIVTRVPCA